MSHEEIQIMNGQLKIIVTITIISLLMLPVHAFAQPCGGYEVTAIIQADECPPFGYPGMIPDGMNDLGWVVGRFSACVIGPDVSWLWTPETGLELLDMPAGSQQSRAIDINNHPERQIVGTVDISDVGPRAFLIDGEDFILIEPPNNGTFSSVAALNDQRQIVGSTADGTPYSKAYIWEDGAMTIIEPTFGPRSAARDINEAGVVVGWMGTNTTDAHAFLWESGGVTDLGPIPGGFTSEASATNNLEQIVGRGKVKRDNVTLIRAFLWENNQYTDLGTLPGFDRCAAIDINDHTTIIGGCDQSDNPKNNQLFVWSQGMMANLNDLIPEGFIINITAVSAINNSGEIAAQAVDEFGDVVGVVLKPVEGSVGDLNTDCEVSVTDLLILLANWGSCESCLACPADLNGDCQVSTQDLLILFSNWG